MKECTAKMGKWLQQTCRARARFLAVNAPETTGIETVHLCGRHANQYRRAGWYLQPISTNDKP